MSVLTLSSPGRAAAPARSARILIVEDEPHCRRVLSLLMERLGYQCHSVSNGQEALEAVRWFQPDAILMDVMMPVLDGLEATRRLKSDARTRKIPILALSGDATAEGRLAAYRAGCDEWLSKPIVLSELVKHLRQHLEP
jgi:CheY-like chemotaxis protein